MAHQTSGLNPIASSLKEIRSRVQDLKRDFKSTNLRLETTIKRYAVIGDSVAEGHGSSEAGWSAQLKSFINLGTQLQDQDLSNRSWCRGKNLADASLSLASATAYYGQHSGIIRSHLDPKHQNDNLFIIALGINDAAREESRDWELVTSDRDFESGLTRISAFCSEFAGKFVFLGLTAVNEAIVGQKVPWIPGRKYLNEDIEKKNALIQDHCSGNGHCFVDTFPYFQAVPGLLADGLHPNQEGHNVITYLVIDELIKSELFQVAN